MPTTLVISVEGIEDDGFCSGLLLGVVIALQPHTFFDVWPGAVNWDESRFYEHMQLTLSVGDAVFFLGNARSSFCGRKCPPALLLGSGQCAEREVDTTCLMDIAAGIGNILPRGVKVPSSGK